MPIISLLCKHVSKAVEVNPLFIGAPCMNAVALWCNESPILGGLLGPTFSPSAYRRRDWHSE